MAEQGSFQAACEKRNISQPAFSRRIRQIEHALGIPLFDRSTRPARLAPYVLEQLDRMRELSVGLRDLTSALLDSGGQRRRLVIVSQHAIAATSTP